MTDKPTPADAELFEVIREAARGGAVRRDGSTSLRIARAVLAKWGTTAPVGVGEAAEHYRNAIASACEGWTMPDGLRKHLETALYTAPQPTQAQAGAVPLTPIRQAALDLYTPPFRHEYGYIRDANHQMVADDASSEATGLIAARIRGWGRIQYMDKPEMRANALQDEVAEMVAEALNAYWAANGIKGGQHGTE